MEKQIKTALISVYDKTGLDSLLDSLLTHGVKLLSTGGTWEFLHAKGIEAEKVEDLTGYPSILGGRVKTLHPAVFGGILARREHAGDRKDMAEHGIAPIDLTIVDLYPFEEALAANAEEAELIEKIDIGGISLIRAAAKNFNDTLIVSSQSQYEEIAELLRAEGCKTTLAQRKRYAAAAFLRSSSYDAAIASYFASEGGEEVGVGFPSLLIAPEVSSKKLRYGENPHQNGVFVGNIASMFEQLHGKELSYNNLLDLDAGIGLLEEFEDSTVAILKHGTPCGLASAFSVTEAWKRALAGDPQSAFGGVILCNRPIDAETAQQMDSIFFEVCLASDYSPEALEILQRRKNRVLLKRGKGRQQPHVVRSALNGYLMQARDTHAHTLPMGETVTRTPLTPEQEKDLLFANRTVKHCKSNAIVVVKDQQLIGVGAGETSRVDAVRHSIEKAQTFGHSLEGAVLASDAFFPFPDSITLAAEAGVRAFVQPGGSIRDKECIAEADNLGVAMTLTNIRHFKH